MAMTIPMLGKSLEDLTGLVKESNKEKGDLAKIVKAKKAAIGFEDFLPEQLTPTLKDITPDGLKNLTQTIEAKEDNNNSYSVILSNMGIFENGKTYTVSADFKATTHIVRQYVTLECINSTKNEVIASNDTPVINGECSCSLSFEYNQTGDDEIHVLFYAGKKEATSGVACEYSNFKVEVLELFSQEEKKAAQQDLDVFLSKTEQYTNVIRNKNGSIHIPDSAEDTEAVNFKTVKEEIKNRIAELIDNAPENLDTLKELAEALEQNKDGITAINAALANRYTKQEVDDKDTSTLTASKNYTNEKIDSLEISQKGVMPVNPICAYDFADVQYRDVLPQELKNYKKVLASIIAEGWCYFYEPRFNTNLKEGCIYKVTADFKVIEGNPTHASILYYNFTLSKVSEWVNTKVVKGRCTASMTFKHTPSAGNMQIVFYSGKAGYTNGIKSEWSNFRIETISDTQAIDSSGNGIHSKIVGDVEKVKDDKGGAALQFNKGKLVRESQNFIGVGKQWTHSRRIKIDKTQPERICFLWFYNWYDWGKIVYGENGVLDYTSTEGKAGNYIEVYIPNILADGKTHTLTVMSDLQPTYFEKWVYLDGKLAGHKRVEEIFNITHSYSRWYDMCNRDDKYHCKGSLSNLLFFDRLLTEQENLWLSLNPQYPIKNYTLADWKLDEANPDREFVTKSSFKLTDTTLEITI